MIGPTREIWFSCTMLKCWILNSVTRYFFNATSGECERFLYGGCRGNENRFEDHTGGDSHHYLLKHYRWQSVPKKRKHQMKVFCYSFFEFIAILLLFMCLASEWIKANFVVVIFYCHRYFRNHYMIIKISTMIARVWGDLQEPIVRGSDQVFGQKFWVLHFRAGIWNLAGVVFIAIEY